MRVERKDTGVQDAQFFTKTDVIDLLVRNAGIEASEAESMVCKFVGQNQQPETQKDEVSLDGPVLLNEKKLYDLKDNEEVIYNVLISLNGDEYHEHLEGRIFSVEEINNDPRVQKLHQECIETIKNMESGPVIMGSGSIELEEQGYYKDIRIVPLLDRVTGDPEKGFAIIGVRKNEDELVYKDQ
jgi:hypothetical protein